MTDILFYHLERRPLEDALPVLLEKSLERGWRCVIQCGSPERRDALDAHLWTYSDAAFLPHGTDAQPRPERQPILITATDANPNRATVRFMVDGATLAEPGAYDRVVHMFDGRDAEAVAAARETWKAARAAGHALTYWQQDEGGRWVKKA
ncbi:DNA polymerase III subunit chi [Aquabacter spiritensis]|uniref:DNA polymerase III subunit chi n=1 Tax=Aquabacter spiritensis TaxID=933073 RepID=UPI001047F2EF|nr:DNA polymerase III subunit chi [Aquabacter spiritensis]